MISTFWCNRTTVPEVVYNIVGPPSDLLISCHGSNLMQKRLENKELKQSVISQCHSFVLGKKPTAVKLIIPKIPFEYIS